MYTWIFEAGVRLNSTVRMWFACKVKVGCGLQWEGFSGCPQPWKGGSEKGDNFCIIISVHSFTCCYKNNHQITIFPKWSPFLLQPFQGSGQSLSSRKVLRSNPSPTFTCSTQNYVRTVILSLNHKNPCVYY